MSRIWYTFIGVCVGLGLAVLAACGSVNPAPAPSANGNDSDIYIYDVNLPDGRNVVCVSNKRGYSGGISCDWSNAK